MAKKELKKQSKLIKKSKQTKKSVTSKIKRGRPQGTGRYGCVTTAVRIPKHLVEEVRQFLFRKIKAAKTKITSDNKSK
ncbi:MAG: hypothetical protein LBE18_06510 [Planctomycetaceae bacterium]|jgi:hypothetical protein|nr:hypothetical protein [Planctomycetaceae bacterium]